MIIFDNIEKAREATFSLSDYEKIEPRQLGDIWFLQDELLPVILENTTLTEEDLEIRELTEGELKILRGDGGTA